MAARSAALTLVAALTLTSSACDPASAVVVPVLVISATWDVQGEEGRRFFFRADQEEGEGLTSGTFHGSENIDDPFAENPLTGYWGDGNIVFTVQRSGGSAVYTATFHDDRPSSLTFYSGAETVTILQP